MLDKKLLRADPESVKQGLARRGEEFAAQVDEFLALDKERREAQASLDSLRNAIGTLSKDIGRLIKDGLTDEAEYAKSEVRKYKETLGAEEASFAELDAREQQLLLAMPNLTHESVPVGGEECAEVVKEWGEPRDFDFEPLDHVELCQRLRLVNFEAGARLAGGGFPVMHGQGAVLQRALINLMLDVHAAEHGYTELRTPFMVHPRCAVGTGQLPKFGSEMYHVSVEGVPPPDDAPDGPHFYLIPTAEVTICNYYRDTILEAPALPIKLCAYSPCWRVEAGSYGKEARGLTRVHQFDKVELVRIADPEHGWDDLEDLTREAEHILELLELPYRRKVLPTGDMTFGSAKTYDLEVHCPAEDAWREISSASNTAEYQARRMNLRIRRSKGDKPVFPHLLNASGTALPRLVIALIETYQTPAGTVTIPQVLRPYMPRLPELTPQENGVPFV